MDAAASRGDLPPAILPFRPPPPTSSSRMSIRAAWERLLRPSLVRQSRSPDWISEHETHVRQWEGFRGAAAAVESVGDVRRSDLEEFQAWCRAHLRNRQGEQVTARTVNKYVETIQAVLRACVHAELIASSPRIQPLPTRKASRKLHLSYDEAEALKRACRVATWPSGSRLPAPLLWETAVVGWCLLGFRTQELVAYESTAHSLTWGNVYPEPLTPHPDGKATWRRGWIAYVPQKQRRLKSDPLVLPVPEALHAHLAEVRRISGGDGPVLPVPHSAREFYAQWRRIVAAAGVRPRPGLNGEAADYQVKHLRKTATRWINDHGATIGCPGIGDFVTGHAADRAPDSEVQSAVTLVHYDFAEDRVLRALTTLPVPESFLAPLCRTRRQLTLF